MSPLNIFVMNLMHDNDNNEINKNKFRTPKFMWKSKIGKNQRESFIIINNNCVYNKISLLSIKI